MRVTASDRVTGNTTGLSCDHGSLEETLMATFWQDAHQSVYQSGFPPPVLGPTCW